MTTATASPATTGQFVLTFEVTEQPENSYRQWCATRSFALVPRSRPFSKGELHWLDVIDPDPDGGVMGVVRQNQFGIEVKLHLKTVGTSAGEPGRTLCDTFKCAGSLDDAGPWRLVRVPPCRNGCPSCLAPDYLTIERG